MSGLSLGLGAMTLAHHQGSVWAVETDESAAAARRPKAGGSTPRQLGDTDDVAAASANGGRPPRAGRARASGCGWHCRGLSVSSGLRLRHQAGPGRPAA